MKITKICEVCSKQFSVAAYRERTARFCSRSCRASKIMTNPLNREAHKAAMAKRRGVSCPRMGGWKHSEEYKEKKRKQMIEYLKKNPGIRNGENNPNWKGGITNKTKIRLSRNSWKKVSREFLLKNPVCQNCKERGSKHTHHVIPFVVSKDDSDKNLMALCEKCHPKLEAAYWEKQRELAIHAKCRQCKGDIQQSILECASYACALWEYRPFRK
jgi:hypothetical protein